MKLKLIKEKLKKYLNLFSCYKKTNTTTKDTNNLPSHIGGQEKIVRSIFSPKNISKSSGTILPNAYRTRSEKDEVSVNRLDYTDANYCKKISKTIEQPNYKKNYFGFGIHAAIDIRNTQSNVVYSPILEPKEKFNIFHSDIKIGIIPEKGKQLPGQFQKKVNDLAKCARLYVDPNPESLNWDEQELK